ncbi:CBS domain protein [Shewanella benthica KT99]|uniref:CBS domain protein n=1 Tax=Shewanella benthica KT99 TaxID=314608 RepID=A9DG34_9GAMM|nr:CBS domain protein [Shewanella benthica KT99]
MRSGAFEVRDDDGELIDRLGEGDYFGFLSLLSGEKVCNRVQILEDGLVYHLDPDTFNYLRGENRHFDRFFNRAFAKRLRHQGRFKAKELATTSRVSTLMSKHPLVIDSSSTVGEAAQQMRLVRVSSVLVIDNHQLVGILTDRDLRNRVLAEGLDGHLPVHQAMTTRPKTLTSSSLVFEAMLLMSEHSINHLPIVDEGKPIGIITSTDILRGQSSQPLLLISEIERQDTVESLIRVSKQIPLLLQNLISADARAEEIGRVLTSVTDALTRRLIMLNQQLLGEAPMAFCWLAFGSQGRQDQAACSGQDNGLLLAHAPDEAAEAYFEALSKSVCAGLDLCGYVYCPGEIMAQNPQWRLTLKQWQHKFETWVNTPEPKALMHASIFFDMRPVYGTRSLFNDLQDTVLANTKGNALINDIARVYALSAGIKEVNTAKRIRQLMELNIINRKDGLNLADAHEFIAHMRLSNQGYQDKHSQEITNYLKPQHLSSLVRHQLKDAFKVVHDAQSGIKLKFTRSF